VNSAEIYIDPAAIEEIAQGFPTIQEAIDNTVDLLRPVSPELASALSENKIDFSSALTELAACHENGGVSQASFWDAHWLIAPAYAASGCTITLIGGEKIVVSDTESCLKILAQGAFTVLISGRAKIAVAKGMAAGVGEEFQHLAEMLSDPKQAIKDFAGVIDMLIEDPKAVGAAVVNGYLEQFANVLIGMESGDYEAVGFELAGLMIEVAQSMTGAGITAVVGAKVFSAVMKAMPNGKKGGANGDSGTDNKPPKIMASRQRGILIKDQPG